MKNTGKLLGALFIGAAIGAVAGILLAPDKGRATRKKIIDGSKGLAGNVKDKLIRSIEGVKELASDMEKKDLKEFYNNVHSASNPAT